MPAMDEAPPQHLIQTQKAEALGRLAGDVAHDLNDILTVITGYANVLLNSEGCTQDMREPLRQIFVAGSRATDRTRDLMAFSPGAGCKSAPRVPAPSAAGSPGGDGGETILLVEDEDSVRDFAAAVLKRSGYRVLQARSGVDALDVWKWHSPRISLLFTDLVMCDAMTGLELADRLLSEKPALKVVCTSGYTEERLAGGRVPPGSVQFLQKPYQPGELAAAVRSALAPSPVK